MKPARASKRERTQMLAFALPLGLGTILPDPTFHTGAFRIQSLSSALNSGMEIFMPALIMWLLGVPITVIIILYLLF
jgi:hypothetical protein